MKIKLNHTEEIVQVDSVHEFVSWMNRTSHTPAINNHMYMVEYARRSVIINDEDIRATSEEDFFADLLLHRHIEVIDSACMN